MILNIFISLLPAISISQVKDEKKKEDEPSLPIPKSKTRDTFEKSKIKEEVPVPPSNDFLDVIISILDSPAPNSSRLQSLQSSISQSASGSAEEKNPRLKALEDAVSGKGQATEKDSRLKALEDAVSKKDQPTEKNSRLKALEDAVSATSRLGTTREIERVMYEIGATNRNPITGGSTRPNDEGEYFWQLDGTAFRTKGKIKSNDGKENDFPAGTLLRDKDDNIKWDFSRNTPLPWTFAIAKLGYKPTSKAYLTHDNNKGSLYPQIDGTLFYTESHLPKDERENKDSVFKKVGSEEKWIAGDPLPSTKTIMRFNLKPYLNSTWLMPDPKSKKSLAVYLLPSGEMVHLERSSNKVYSFKDEHWKELTGTAKETLEIAKGIKTLEEVLK